MRSGLMVALVVSIVLHVVLLFAPNIDLSFGDDREALPIMAQIKLLPPPQPMVDKQSLLEKAAEVRPKKRPSRNKTGTETVASDVLPPVVPLFSPDSVSSSAPEHDASGDSLPPEEVEQPQEVAPSRPRLPPRGEILYRVDRGDSNFQIGEARHEWEILDGHYRISSVIETTGLAWLIKSYRVEMESDGVMTAEGLRPRTFVIRRNGEDSTENATFDWDRMKVRIGNRAEQDLDAGAQDFLSFNYQLGYLAHPEVGSTLPIATGKKYGVFRLEVLGDEEIQVPAGTLRTLHLRAPGANTTELWLAYDYLLLPVKIRFVDAKGGVFVQVATQIQLAPIQPSPP